MESQEKYQAIFENTGTATIIIEEDTTISLVNTEFERLSGYSKKEVEGKKKWKTFVAKGDLERLREYHRLRIIDPDVAPRNYEFRFIDRQGSTKNIFMTIGMIPGTKKNVASLLDVTEMKKAQEALRIALEESRKRQAEIAALMEGTRIVLESRDFSDAAQSIFNSCKHLIGATAGYIALMSQDGTRNEVVFLDSGGLPCTLDPDLPMPIRGLREVAYRTGKTACHNDFSDSEFVKFIPEGHARLENVLFAPLVIKGKAVGLLGLANKPGGFTEEDSQLASGFGELAAIALVNKRAEEHLRREHDDLERRVQERTAELVKLNEELRAEISERKDAEEALRQSETRLAEAQRIAHLGNWDWDIKTNELHWSDEIYRIFGLLPQQFGATYEAFLNCVHPDDREYIKTAVNDALTKRKPYTIDHRIVLPNGTVRIVHEQAEVTFDETGNPIRMLGTVQDITELKNAEEERLRMGAAIEEAVEERLRLAVVMEQTAEGIMITDTDGTIQYINPAFERMTGYMREEIIGEKSVAFRRGEHDESFYKGIQDTLSRGEVWKGHLTRKKKDGMISELEATISPVRDQWRTIINYVAIERDVTHQVKLEQHLRHTQKMQALGTLAGGIAHDLNNILMPIIINTELALDDVTKESPSKSYWEQVLDAAYRGKDLVQQIITFSRRSEQDRKPMKIAPLVKEALKLLRASLPVTIEMHHNIKTNSGVIMADSTQMHQVLMNLCSNAAYAMREKGGVLDVSLVDVELDSEMAERYADLKVGPYIKLTVSDTGHGMDRTVMERIFEPFFTTKEAGEGTGMGLALVHGIVKDHDGAITVYSEPGEGSTFTVFLPRIKEDLPSQPVSSTLILTGKERILFVDDEEAVIQGVQNMLARLGYTVIAKTDSIEALESFRAQPDEFDLVITDQTMPQMTGVTLAEELKRIRPDIPIIMCTGFSEVISAEQAKAVGIQEFIMKPLGSREIAETIRRVLLEAKG